MVDIAERRRVINDGEGREGLDRLVRENWRIEVVVKKVEGVTLISRRRANVVLGGSFQAGLNLPRGLCVVSWGIQLYPVDRLPGCRARRPFPAAHRRDLRFSNGKKRSVCLSNRRGYIGCVVVGRTAGNV